MMKSVLLIFLITVFALSGFGVEKKTKWDEIAQDLYSESSIKIDLAISNLKKYRSLNQELDIVLNSSDEAKSDLALKVIGALHITSLYKTLIKNCHNEKFLACLALSDVIDNTNKQVILAFFENESNMIKTSKSSPYKMAIITGIKKLNIQVSSEILNNLVNDQSYETRIASLSLFKTETSEKSVTVLLRAVDFPPQQLRTGVLDILEFNMKKYSKSTCESIKTAIRDSIKKEENHDVKLQKEKLLKKYENFSK